MMSCVNRSENFYLAFTDFAQAFDQVDPAKLLNILRDRGVKRRCLLVLSNTFTEQTAVMRGNPPYQPFSKNGVRQGCVYRYTDHVMNKISIELCVKIGDSFVNRIMCGYDTVIIESSQEDLQESVNQLSQLEKDLALT